MNNWGERWRGKEAFIWLAPSLSVVSTIEGRDLRLSDSLDLSLSLLSHSLLNDHSSAKNDQRKEGRRGWNDSWPCGQSEIEERGITGNDAKEES